ncbi:LysR family transcriptional regulator [Saccharomonospora cyanea]|uniref:LysR family transcriptional regulator n=1 Tax=Saccharomonospora cyanea TaxID=40989 RepID=UPI0003020257|nr:LysR family transcriptional regulator [Saccharomonospora cyanea]
MNLDAVRAFTVAADSGQFQEAAAELSITQQAVSKRIAALERDLGVRLFDRTAKGVVLTVDGRAFLPHAHELLLALERAAASVRQRALRVDVVGHSLAPSGVLRAFHRAHPETELDVVTLPDLHTAIAGVRSGAVDASFRALPLPPRKLPAEVATARVLDEQLRLLTGPAHALAASGVVTLTELAEHPIWMPGIVAGTEWAAYYDELATAFGLTIDTSGPDFGIEPLLDAVAESPVLATLVGEGTRLAVPTAHDLRLIVLHGPTPVYPHSLLWRRGNPHPGLTALRDHLGSVRAAPGVWVPGWARR